MMQTKQIFEIIDSALVQNLIDYYNEIGTYDTVSMNKAPPGKALDIVRTILEEQIGKKLDYVQGNFYKHNQPYFPHTDYKTYQNGKINVVIPLSFSSELPHLIIFDQIWELDSVTWCMHHPVKNFKVNIGVKGSPYEYPVTGLTGEPIDKELHKNFLSQYPFQTLFGLSGNAYPFSSGSVIIFDSRRIHCTAKMTGEKLGLTLRFK
jgi:hypothetical protein